MCGICGIVAFPGATPVVDAEIRPMMAAMRHRGPDGEGCWVSPSGTVMLGHRRLAIVDLSDRARQPMSGSSASVQISFNGEIYNFRELRRALESRGYRFRSDSDAEVLGFLYEERGAELVHDLDGDFAFAVWDESERKLLLARDRAGVKPLYYSRAGDRLVFASEIKALLAHPLVDAELDESSLYHYLTFLTTPGPETMFRGISKLPAGCLLQMQMSGRGHDIQVARYWSPASRPPALDDGDLDARLEELFRASVKKRLMSDVPVGVLLSGGVDSALNAAFFQQESGRGRVRTFCVGVGDSASTVDESREAAAVAARLGTEHHTVQLTEGEALRVLPELVRCLDEPLADPVALPIWAVARLARQTGTTVLHAGEGADELFCGYPRYMRLKKLHRRLWQPLERLPGSVLHALRRVVGSRNSPWGRKVHDALRRVASGQQLHLSSAVGFFESEKATVLSRGFQARMQEQDSFESVRPVYEALQGAESSGAGFLHAVTVLELSQRLPELLLMRMDKPAMAHSVEVRVPFLDRDLIDFALAAPESFKLRGGIPKEPLKRLCAATTDHDHAYRPKVGFGVPIAAWLGNALGTEMRGILEEDRRELGAFFSVDRILTLQRDYRTVNQAFQLWTILIFCLWRREYLS